MKADNRQVGILDEYAKNERKERLIIRTRLEFFEIGAGLLGAKLGLISISDLEKYDMYKTYLEFLESYKDMDEIKAHVKAHRDTEVKYNCNYHMVRRARVFFEGGKILQIYVNGHPK